MSLAVELNNVSFRYLKNGKRLILDHTTLSLEEGSFTLIMGGSGSGKSTLATVMAGLYPENGGFLTEGTIRLFGRPLREMTIRERTAYLTILFQNPELQFCMDTLRQELRFCLENICVPPEEMDARAEKAASLLGASHLLDRKLYTLSGGEMQRAALSCLYLLGSRCLVFDESLSNLDEKARQELLEIIVRLHHEGRTIIVIDHRADLWLDWADEIILLEKGARPYRRGITSSNIQNFRKDFEALGLFFPGEAYQGQTVSYRNSDKKDGTGEPGGESILTFRDFSVGPGEAAKGRGRKIEQRPYLLERASAEFPKGALCAILGESGSGKTTTFMSVLKQHPYEGEIFLENRRLSSFSGHELYRRVGIVFQNPSHQFVAQSVEDEVMISLKIWQKGKKEEELLKMAEDLLEEYGLKEFHRYSPYMLSQGQQRRLAVLSMLAGGQKLLLLDEPTYGQDAASVHAIMSHLRRKTQQDGISVIFITHDRELAVSFADKIYCLQEKKLVAVQSQTSLHKMRG